jgi:hypothetical protein
MPGKYVRGALVEFKAAFLVPLPNVIVFQYNPETITHTWLQPEAPGGGEKARNDPLALRGTPGETFSFTIAMDAGDTVADGGPAGAALAAVSGVYSRLAALEMLLFPSGSSVLGDLVGSVSVSIGSGGISASAAAKTDTKVPASEAPVAVFVWGPGRIVPVRVTGLTVTEKLYDALLIPTHAEAQLSLRVLTPEELGALKGMQKSIANVAYKYTQGLREALAIANLANSAESVIGMLPF